MKLPKQVWKLLSGLIIANGLFAFRLYSINPFKLPLEIMMNNLNDLMDSENRLMETYFDLKAKFII